MFKKLRIVAVVLLLAMLSTLTACSGSTVSFTIPEDLAEFFVPGEISDDASVTFNDDGSISIEMPASSHAELMQEMRDGLIESLDSFTAEYVSIQDITYNNRLTEFTVVVNREAFENSFDGFVVWGISFSASFFHLFNGNPDTQFTINIQDAATMEIFDTHVFPE